MIHELLHTGCENPTPASEICMLTGLSRQSLSRVVMKERREGWAICSSTHEPHGYYMAKDTGEMIKFCERLRHRAGEIFATRKACLQAISKLPLTKQD